MTAKYEEAQAGLDRRTSEFRAQPSLHGYVLRRHDQREEGRVRRLQLSLSEAMGDNSKSEKKIQELEQKIFELELTIGMN